ncbi:MULTISPECIES: anti-sigma F factor antagonist [unclassified Lysinibacillus]|uniref:anti-sigma F factor antagonist n=1 Tax=unclassified Lysinibacillus TaxID=2636778 RepID=UPI00190013EA|nr:MULTISPECIES: anti-sigma F factor antagonist [unclassified Lysinibacillus]
MKFNMTFYPNEVLVIQLFGELDHHETEKVRSSISKAIFQGNVKYLIWNLEQLQFMDSSGIGLVLGRIRELRAVDGQTILLNPSITMQKIFQFSGLGNLIQIGSEQEVILQARGIVNG